jgi:hypothetical protein
MEEIGMNFYIGTIIASIIFKIIAKIKEVSYMANSLKKINYLDIGKYNVSSKRMLGEKSLPIAVINLIILLIPGINLFAYGYILYKSQNKELISKNSISREVMFSIPRIIEIYENQKSIEDSFKIDGLSKEEIRKETRLGNQELGYAYITDDMYNDIKVSKNAIEYLNKFEQNKNLTRKDKIKLLREYKKAFINVSKDNIEPIEKTLKITNR